MTQEQKKLWIEALRSGKYKQGTELLYYTDAGGDARHCCLGVACDIGIATPGKRRRTALPEGFLSLDIQNHLASKNDRGMTFLEISNYIEANL